MIDKSDISVSDVIALLSNYKIAPAFLVPTITGMEKSIMDATSPIRNFLEENKIHSYASQGKGTENKRTIEAFFIRKNEISGVKVSLYRPETKSGDPRIWIYGLSNLAVAYNLLVLFAAEGGLYIFNASDKGVLTSITNKTSPLGKLASQISCEISNTANELLYMLRDRAGSEFIPSVRYGDTGIGATLEDLLGIKSNSRKTPDYKGIEIKASRQDSKKIGSSNRVNLFSQVPDWKNSPLDKAINVLKKYGYVKDSRLQLYCTLDGIKTNSQNLMLKVDESAQLLKTIEKNSLGETPVMFWALQKLKERLAEKHPESFWVKAETKIISGKEHFRYYKVVHTTKPILSNLDYLLGDGTVTLDLTISQKTDNSVRDHGYLFKIWPEDFNSLFPTPLVHEISSDNFHN